MTEFHKRLSDGQNKAQATQKARAKPPGGARYNHPFYWLPFALPGDWR